MKHFDDYNDAINRIKELTYKLIVLEHNLYGIKGVNFDRMPMSTSTNDRITKMISDKDDIMAELTVLYEEKKKLYNKHLAEINKVDNEQYRSILRCYYLLKLSLDEISSFMSISTSHVKRLRSKALEQFKIQNDIN